MWNCHELGQCRSSKDSMIRSFKISYLEPDVLCPVVFFGPKGNYQTHLNKGYSCVAWDDPVEWRLHWGEHICNVKAHFPQGFGKEYVETTAAINEYFCE